MKTLRILAAAVASAQGFPAQAGSGFLTIPVMALQTTNITNPAVSLKSALNQKQSKSGSIVLLWRSDCAPCLVELSRIAALQEAAGRIQISTLALEPPDQARASAQRFSIPPKKWLRVTAFDKAGLGFCRDKNVIYANVRYDFGEWSDLRYTY